MTGNESARTQLLTLYGRHEREFVLWLSTHYPFSLEAIDRHAERLFFGTAMSDLGLSLLQAFVERWDWEKLSRNPGVPWTRELIDAFVGRWDWEGLSENAAVPWSEELIEHFADRLDWGYLSCNEGIAFSPRLLERFAEQWAWELALDQNPAVGWDEALLAKYGDRVKWKMLSANSNVSISADFVRANRSKLLLRMLGKNQSCGWTAELLDELAGELDWSLLSRNTGLPWSRELVGKYLKRWNFSSLSCNQALPWSLDLVLEFEKHWDWEALLLGQKWALGFKGSPVWDRFGAPVVDDALVDEMLSREPDDLGPAFSALKKSGKKRPFCDAVKAWYGLDKLSSNVKPYLLGQQPGEGILKLEPFIDLWKNRVSFRSLFDRFGNEPFPAVCIGSDGLGTEFWVLLESAKVISLHHDATFYEVAGNIRSSDPRRFVREFAKAGSVLTLPQLFALQDESCGLDPDDAVFPQKLFEAAQRVLAIPASKLQRRMLRERAFEFLFVRCRDLLE